MSGHLKVPEMIQFVCFYFTRRHQSDRKISDRLKALVMFLSVHYRKVLKVLIQRTSLSNVIVLISSAHPHESIKKKKKKGKRTSTQDAALRCSG